MDSSTSDKVFAALETFRIELPSWGFANTGTRFGKFIQAAAATTTEEKFSDAGQVHLLTGVCPTVALHVLWDCPQGVQSSDDIKRFAARYGVHLDRSIPIFSRISNTSMDHLVILTNPFGDRLCSIRRTASKSLAASIAGIFRSGSRMDRIIPGQPTFASASNGSLTRSRRPISSYLPTRRMLVEYKPFEPAFYHTDIADWGMALLLSRAAGPQAKVLVDTGHHYAAQNIEQIVAWLLSEDMLGGFHFNDRRYADDDLTMGSIDPYQVFRIFHEIRYFEWETGQQADIAYMVDQSHNLKGKIEAMIQTVTMAQQLFAKAALVDASKLAAAQKNCGLVEAESLLQNAFATDVRPAIQEWRDSKGLPKDPMEAFRAERVPRAHHERTSCEEFSQRFFLCLAPRTPNLIWRSISELRADAPSSRDFNRGFLQPKKSIAFPINLSNTEAHSIGMRLAYGLRCARL